MHQDEQVKESSAPVKLKISNVQGFVSIWMASTADAVAKRYRPWPLGLGLTACRGSTPPWSRARVDCGIQIKLKCSGQGTCPRWRSRKKIWMASTMPRNLRIIAAGSTHPSLSGPLDSERMSKANRSVGFKSNSRISTYLQ